MTARYDGPKVVRRCIKCGWISRPCKTPGTAAHSLRRHSCDRHRATLARAEKARTRGAAIDRTPKPCHHKVADHQHGTAAAYALDGCRCVPCSRARSVSDTRRARLKAYGRYDRYVDAELVRAHVRALQAAGMGLKQIAKVSGVSHGALWKLICGKKQPDGTYRPTERVTRSVADRIFAIQDAVLADGRTVDSTGTARRIQALVAIGWSASKIACRLGILRGNFTVLLRGQRRVTVETAKAVADLYDELWATLPPRAEHRDKIAFSRARNYAAKHGWVPPLAWDDDTIDDPAATPYTDGNEHVSRAEQIRDLHNLGCGLREIAKRLGSTYETLHRAALRTTPDILPELIRRDERRKIAAA